jgi:hypothetical protein
MDTHAGKLITKQWKESLREIPFISEGKLQQEDSLNNVIIIL